MDQVFGTLLVEETVEEMLAALDAMNVDRRAEDGHVQIRSARHLDVEVGFDDVSMPPPPRAGCLSRAAPSGGPDQPLDFLPLRDGVCFGRS